MRALVTGGAGFVGAHLTEGLVAQGNAVLVVDDLSHTAAQVDVRASMTDPVGDAHRNVIGVVSHYGRWFSDARGIDVVALRYGNSYGPRQEFSGESGAVVRFCVAAPEGRPTVVYGDGPQSRDFVFVDDVVKANIAVAQCGGHEFDEYNVGTGVEVTVMGLLDTISSAAGLEPRVWPPNFVSVHEGEVHGTVSPFVV